MICEVKYIILEITDRKLGKSGLCIFEERAPLRDKERNQCKLIQN